MSTRRFLTVRETADAFLLRQGRATTCPAIRLQGLWLARAGFAAGHKVNVHVEDGRLVIVPQGSGREPPFGAPRQLREHDAVDEKEYLAFIFDPPLEAKVKAVNGVIDEAHQRGHEVRVWSFEDRLIVCVAVLDVGADTGTELCHVLRARHASWDEVECASPAEFYQALAVPPGHKLLIQPVPAGR
jgi:hypothetical protein